MVVPDLIWLGPRLAGGSVHPHEPRMDVFLDHWAWATPMMAPVLALSIGAWVLAAWMQPS